MHRTILCDIVSVESTLFSSPVRYVVVTAEQGDIGVYPGHAPLLTLLKAGIARLVMEDGTEEVIFISGGFMEVQPHKVILLTDFAERAMDLDEAAAQLAKQHAEEHLGSGSTDLDHARALRELNEAVARLRAIDMKRNYL